jgi:hypothetical protein
MDDYAVANVRKILFEVIANRDAKDSGNVSPGAAGHALQRAYRWVDARGVPKGIHPVKVWFG